MLVSIQGCFQDRISKVAARLYRQPPMQRCSGSEEESRGTGTMSPLSPGAAGRGKRRGRPRPFARSARPCRSCGGACPRRRARSARPDTQELLTSLASPLPLRGPARRQRVPAAPLAPAPAGRVSFGREDVAQKEPRRGRAAGRRRSPSRGHAGTPGPCPGPGGGGAQSLWSALGRHSKYPSNTSSSLSVS